jgi:hypothetical protein
MAYYFNIRHKLLAINGIHGNVVTVKGNGTTPDSKPKTNIETEAKTWERTQ